MARVVQDLVPIRCTYPWPRWTDGRAWRAERGVDFRCTVAGFRSSLYMRAQRMNRRVVVLVHKNAVEFQFLSDAPKTAEGQPAQPLVYTPPVAGGSRAPLGSAPSQSAATRPAPTQPTPAQSAATQSAATQSAPASPR